MSRYTTLMLVAACLLAAPIPASSHDSNAPDTAEAVALYQADHEDEARRLTKANGLAVRRDATLTVTATYNGTPVAEFTDQNPYECPGASPCETWTFAAELTLRSAPDAQPESYALILYAPGVGGKAAIVDHDGQLVWIDFDVLPGKRYVASGSASSQHTPRHFMILDWASPGHAIVYRTERGCIPVRWLSLDRLLAACDTEDGRHMMGEFSARPNGDWVFDQNGWVDDEYLLQARLDHTYMIDLGPAPMLTFALERTTYSGQFASTGYPSEAAPKGYRKIEK